MTSSGERRIIYPRGSSTQIHDVAAAGGLASSVHSALPTGSADNRGVLLRLEGATAVADTNAIVAKMSNDAYTAGRVRVDGVGYMIARCDAVTTLVDDTSTQALFASANDNLKVEAGMTYRFRAAIRITKGTNAVSMNGLLSPTTATFTTCNYISLSTTAAAGTAAAAVMNNHEAATTLVWTASSASVNLRVFLEGEFEINAAGTLAPSVIFSGATGSTPTVNVGSFFECWPIGANPVTAIGPWA
jgi:hypothetical protein